MNATPLKDLNKLYYRIDGNEVIQTNRKPNTPLKTLTDFFETAQKNLDNDLFIHQIRNAATKIYSYSEPKLAKQQKHVFSFLIKSELEKLSDVYLKIMQIKTNKEKELLSQLESLKEENKKLLDSFEMTKQIYCLSLQIKNELILKNSPTDEIAEQELSVTIERDNLEQLQGKIKNNLKLIEELSSTYEKLKNATD
ncbi:hypothetical protein BN1013_01660 [Candidatus Rubidus massiliensis]|nr:hypothetical protein BN1013_01660 [Candidatus Rubidus massiliensis]